MNEEKKKDTVETPGGKKQIKSEEVFDVLRKMGLYKWSGDSNRIRTNKNHRIRKFKRSVKQVHTPISDS